MAKARVILGGTTGLEQLSLGNRIQQSSWKRVSPNPSRTTGKSLSEEFRDSMSFESSGGWLEEGEETRCLEEQ